MQCDFRQYADVKDYINDLIAQGKATNKTSAFKLAQKLIPKESYYQTKILEFLKQRRYFAYKNMSTMYQQRGLPDIECIINGQYFGFEVKRPLLGKPTLVQQQTADHIRASGGIVEFVTYVDEVDIIINNFMDSKKQKLAQAFDLSLKQFKQGAEYRLFAEDAQEISKSLQYLI